MADYIEREAAIKELRNHCEVVSIHAREYTAQVYEMAYRHAEEMLNALPSADVKPVVHGKWIIRGGKFRCSVCDGRALWKDEGGTGGFSYELVQVRSSFCPNCGADMREVDNG